MITLMKTYNYILIDWDGTLLKTLDLWLGALKGVLNEHGYSLADSQIGANYSVFKKRAHSLGVNNSSLIVEEAERIVAETKDTPLYDGTYDFIKSLHSQKKIALVTTSTHSQVDQLLIDYNLSHYIDSVVCGDDVIKQKPDSEPLLMALKMLGGTLDEAVMIGDSGTDIQAASNAKIDSILYYPSTHHRFYDLASLKALKPTHIATSFQNISDLVMK